MELAGWLAGWLGCFLPPEKRQKNARYHLIVFIYDYYCDWDARGAASITVQFCWVYPSEHKPSAARRGMVAAAAAWWVGERPADIVNGVISNCIRLALLLLLALVYTDCW